MLEHPQLLGLPEGSFTVQHTFLTVAVWWGLFALPLIINLKEKPSPHTPGIVSSASEAFQRLRHTFRRLRRFRQLTRFLGAYLLFNDGIETVIIMAAIFGDQELGMSQGLLIAYFLLVQFTAFLGALLFGKLTVLYGNKHTLLLTLFIWCGVVLAAFFIGWKPEL